jgi:hypothetical protein
VGFLPDYDHYSNTDICEYIEYNLLFKSIKCEYD